MGNEDFPYGLVRIKWTVRRPFVTKTETSGTLIIDFYVWNKSAALKVATCKIFMERNHPMALICQQTLRDHVDF